MTVDQLTWALAFTRTVRNLQMGVGIASWVMQKNNTTKLTKDNIVFQVELLPQNEAVKYAITLWTNLPVTTFVDNRASIQVSSSPKTTNRTAREVLEKPHIKISWIKAHVGHFGNETADSLVKAEVESNEVLLNIKLPKCDAKNILRKDLMKRWHS
ncbi:hypothetical protein AVEN_148207-1 [Araneus ventricosus]|uniref:RNase H type-1 domain-containing protein n=1 Tax=Araneus ventricosus TaxID=182803 RepID=A0A4Y2DBR2_ARAVE|nr:hypothetical protein AVEN_148207-1 [Araneus ventricosus]